METNPYVSTAWAGRLPGFTTPPRRVVSLVPSITESLYDLGAGGLLVGCTDYCTHPARETAALDKVGGPKDVRVGDVLALSPDFVIASQEENQKEAVEALAASGLSVWVIHPRSVSQAFEVLWGLAHIFQSDAAVYRILSLEPSYEWTKAAAGNSRPWRYFCPIWYEENPVLGGRWMTFNASTYPADLLAALGGQNVFAGAVREGGGDGSAYPWVSAQALRQVDPEIILLPDEPYPFSALDAQGLRSLFPMIKAVRDEKLILLDGSLITWYGTRLARALDVLPNLLGI